MAYINGFAANVFDMQLIEYMLNAYEVMKLPNGAQIQSRDSLQQSYL